MKKVLGSSVGAMAIMVLIVAVSAGASPNILLILADDLGYGDVGCYNPESRVPTPHLDRLAAEGMRFTDAHSPSTVCTPSRYSILTGRMCFRTGYRGVFVGVGGPSLIAESQLTLPQLLRDHGCATACVGKWHVGMTFTTHDGRPAHAVPIEVESPADWREGGPALERVRRTDFSRPIPDGPIHRGFDYFFGTACCPTTDWLYAFIEQDQVVVAPTGQLERTHLPRHAYSHDNRRGLIAPGYDLETVDLEFLAKSKAWLEQHVQERPNQPFFLFHSMQAVHLPSFPAPRFQCATEAGPHGDFIFEMDQIVGELLATLDQLGVADDTVVIFASDNGPEVSTTVHMRQDQRHDPARPWRGMKRDDWEGGHRTPLIVRWPGRVAAGVVSDELTSLTDLMATCAAICSVQLPADAAEDSFNLLPAWLGEVGDAPIRPYLLQQTISLAMSIRAGNWKLLDHRGSGGNNYERNAELQPYILPESAPDAEAQLYDLDADPGETRNLINERPEVAARLRGVLELAKERGRHAFESNSLE
ncbi:MAG: arylsulfatase [Planctomycetales bacterium]|nr:arylsulfatase [Planctomycetales bacterium]